jgi:hypothetical protein
VRSWRALRLKIAVRRGKGVLRPCTWPDGCGGPLGAALSAVSAPLRRNLSGRPKHETERRFAPVRRTSRGKRRVRLQRDGSGGPEYEKVCRSELANTGGMPTGVPHISANFSFSHTKSNMRQWPSMLPNASSSQSSPSFRRASKAAASATSLAAGASVSTSSPSASQSQSGPAHTASPARTALNSRTSSGRPRALKEGSSA